jgi:DNA-nicking Smr family endonuclease
MSDGVTGTEEESLLITVEELSLWRQIIRDAVPLSQKHYVPPHAPLPAKVHRLEPEKALPRKAARPASLRKKDYVPFDGTGLFEGSRMPPLSSASPKAHALLHAGDLTRLDRRTAERFRKGKIPRARILDLHGMDQVTALDALKVSIEMAWLQEKRMLQVITGKGKDGEGVLKGLLPRWLNLPELRQRIAAFSHAQPQDGGSGAWYIYIRRQRV